ncbi:hypothetical protein C8Q75DRAFT_787542 [Abortiporus biennis]|nr:hypothetical protein C8Q75DRAFT_787542 [Abortiporus biennis]
MLLSAQAMDQSLSWKSLLIGLCAIVTCVHASNPSFDGQHIRPTANNSAVAWWWSSVAAEPNPNSSLPPASIQVVFFQGQITSPHNPLSPEYYVTVNGFMPDGTSFAETLSAETSQVSESGERVVGTWKNVGSFVSNSVQEISKFSLTLDGPDSPVKGTITITSDVPRHLGCSSNEPTFNSAIPRDNHLSGKAKTFYTQLGWTVSISAGRAVVDLQVDGKPLAFSGTGYHDQNWMPIAFMDLFKTWYFGTAQAGPYVLAYLTVQVADSSYVFNSGYLSKNGKLLQKQCNTDKITGTDISVLKPFGVLNGTQTEVPLVPAGYSIEYVGSGGERFKFDLTSLASNPDLVFYHRSVAKVRGGEVGKEQYDGVGLTEWLNPALELYIPSSS